MSVNTRIYLPANVRVEEVGAVIARLLGDEAEMKPLGGPGNPGQYVSISTLNVQGIPNIPGCANIYTKTATVMFHFEVLDEEGTPARLLMPRATPTWIAVGRKLVSFFGGTMAYSDDGHTEYAVQPRSNDRNHPEDGEPWQYLQNRIFAVQPLTEAEVKEWIEYAAYDDNGLWR